MGFLIFLALTPSIKTVCIIGFSSTEIESILSFKTTTTSLKNPVLYKSFKILLIVNSSIILFSGMSENKIIVSFDIRSLPLILILLTISAKVTTLKKNNITKIFNINLIMIYYIHKK